MARLPRLGPAGVPQHIIQRGNNRQICFGSDQDLAFYLSCLMEYSVEFSVRIHAWVLMTNHVHLLATPSTDGAVSQMMQALGRRYVRYFNRAYERSGTLWEGRFKSSLVQTSQYLIQCQRYIELNPVRAGMVNEPADYPWCSYQCSALGIPSELFTPHEVYLALGENDSSRRQNYREIFKAHVEPELMTDIRNAVNQGMALGSEQFKEELEVLLNRRVRPATIGRPRTKKGTHLFNLIR